MLLGAVVLSLILQTDPQLPEVFHQYGCHLLVHFAMVQLETGRAMTAEEITRAARELIAQGTIDRELSLNLESSPWQTVKVAAAIMNNPTLRIAQVGQLSDGAIQFWRWVEQLRFDYAIQRRVLSNGREHSVLYDRNLVMLYDPAGETTLSGVKVWLLYRIMSGR